MNYYIKRHKTVFCDTVVKKRRREARMKKWKNTVRSIVAKVMILVMAAATVSGSLPAITVRAEDGIYPYMIFAASEEEGAVTLQADNTGLNGSVATNGSITVIGGNCNINGTRTERAGANGGTLFMPDLRERIEAAYFAAGTEEHTGDYALEEININIKHPSRGTGRFL